MRPIRPRLSLLVALLAGAVAAMVMLGRCSHRPKSPFARAEAIAGGDTLNIAIEFNGICYGVRGDSVFGRDYDIIERIARSRSIPVKYHPFVPLGHATEGLRDGRYDIVIASMPLTVELKQRFVMTDPVYLDREILVQHRPDTAPPAVRTALDLAADTVWLPEDSPFASRVAALGREIGDTIYVSTLPGVNAEHLVVLTALGRIPRAVVPATVARRLAPRYPALDTAVAISFTQFQSWALRDTALRDSINLWLKL